MQHLWPGVGWIYLFVCLAGLGGGLWPDLVWPMGSDFRPASLPTLQALAVSQILFFALAWPVLEFRRPDPTSLAGQAVTTAGLFFLTMPLYLVAAWFSDATFVDCIRAGFIVLAIAPLGWVAGRALRVQSFRGPVMLGLVLVVLGLPGAYYFLREFYPQISIAWLWRASPVGLVWCGAVSRETFLLPKPIWTLLVWPVIAAALLFVSHCKSKPNLHQ